MGSADDQMGGVATGEEPSEEELRAAYEAELNRITSAEMILQTTVSLINIAGRRLGLGAPSPTGDSNSSAGDRDLEQVRDAIDGTRALMPILERRMPHELGPLRDALSQLQMAYAREAQSGPGAADRETPPQPTKPMSSQAEPPGDEPAAGPGPAQASGRLWVPGR